MKLPFAAVAVLFAVCVWGQPEAPVDTANPRNVLKRVGETYRNLDSFEWAAVTSIATNSGRVSTEPTTVLGEFRRPGQIRLEFPKRAPVPLIAVSDGHAAAKLYSSRYGFCRPDPKVFLERTTPHDAMFALAWSLPYEHITDGLQSARVLGTQKLKIGNKLVNCRVVTAAYIPARSAWTGRIEAAPIMYWLDLKRTSWSNRVTILRARFETRAGNGRRRGPSPSCGIVSIRQ